MDLFKTLFSTLCFWWWLEICWVEEWELCIQEELHFHLKLNISWQQFSAFTFLNVMGAQKQLVTLVAQPFGIEQEDMLVEILAATKCN